jgi:hypothetical protein
LRGTTWPPLPFLAVDSATLRARCVPAKTLVGASRRFNPSHPM